VSSLPAAAVLALFATSAMVIWVAGIGLSRSTDALDARFKLGSALGGLVLLAIATDLPELAITVAAAIGDNLDLAVGNLLGGIAMQTLVLAALDAGSGEGPITHRVGSLILVLEACMVIAVTVAAVMTSQLSDSLELTGVSPGSFAIVLLWIAGLWTINRARRGIPWEVHAPGAQPGRNAVARAEGTGAIPFRGRSSRYVIFLFGVAALATLAAGILIEESGSDLANRAGISGAVFGATILAAFTALPELSTGLAAVKLGDNELAMSDIFGGNAFLPVLFVLADAIAGKPVLVSAHGSDIWLSGLAVLLTAVYIVGLIMRPTRSRLRLGPDSIAVILLYALGIIGLVAVNS
jgi:cation:H+ antiporter